VVILLAIFKTFYFVRIFKNFSGIVVMLINVMVGLRIFLFFYLFLVYLFGLIFMVIGAGNKNVPGKLREEYLSELENGEEIDLPNPEYKNIGLFWGNLMYVFRTSVGDFDFEASTYLTSAENWLFYLCWILVSVLTMIIFLNFIISEIGGIYNDVYERKEMLVQKEKSALIKESESMMFDK